MAEALRDSYGPEIPRRIAAMVSEAHPPFHAKAFLRDCLRGYDGLGLLARGSHIADALRAHLPASYPEALGILLRSAGPRLDAAEGNGMAPFLYLPHVAFVARHGLGHFEESMRAQYELTKRFSAEFSIRAFIERFPEATLARLAEWARDPDFHVRRLVSEGTRPRLPWAPRLREFQRDPAPVLELLELLKDDPSLYVRRSVANNLNDIGKDHPGALVATARRWLLDAGPERRWIVRHALRSVVKRGEPQALEVLGYQGGSALSVVGASITPARARIGGSVVARIEISNPSRARQSAIVDLRVHFVKANGRAAPKVFKLKAVELLPGETTAVAKRVSLAQLTTRRHYPGKHRVEVVVNGHAEPVGEFDLAR